MAARDKWKYLEYTSGFKSVVCSPVSDITLVLRRCNGLKAKTQWMSRLFLHIQETFQGGKLVRRSKYLEAMKDEEGLMWSCIAFIVLDFNLFYSVSDWSKIHVLSEHKT